MPTRDILIATAGHIDHGKSSLIRALTGVDPDRLPEERSRGMTIELGFARLATESVTLHFVDVPGHERFIRTMVAGATGVDAALLVVAADDGVMPQTREHVEVLSLLGVRTVVVALSKADLVDDKRTATVQADVAALLGEYGLTVAAAIATAATSGRGIPELSAALSTLPEARPPSATWLRLPIDRVFTVAGRGTVVTGSLWHGQAAIGDELELLPAGRRVRLRDLQSHGDASASAGGRIRLACNLAGLTTADVHRGDELATPGYLTATTCLTVRLAWLRAAGKRLGQRLRVRVHLGTREVRAEVRLLDPPSGPQVSDAVAQLRTNEPVVATWGQPLVIRDDAATATLGGGKVLEPVAEPWTARRPPQLDLLTALAADDADARVLAAVRLGGWRSLTAERLAGCTGLAGAAAATGALERLSAANELITLADQSVHPALLDEAAARVTARLTRFLDANPRSAGVTPAQISTWLPRAIETAQRSPVVAEFVRRKVLVETGTLLTVPDRADTLTSGDRRLLAALLSEYAAGGFSPPTVADLRANDGKNERRLRELLKLATQRGQLIQLSDKLYLAAEVWSDLVTRVRAAIAERGPLTVAEIRTLLNSSRKYVVPIVEHLDRAGITRRVGDRRELV
jgi:selenocysteine-specific elongation factor